MKTEEIVEDGKSIIDKQEFDEEFDVDLDDYILDAEDESKEGD
jgi:hypothetical protein